MDSKILKDINQKLDNELTQLYSDQQNLIIRAETAAGICQLALDEIRKLVIKNGFESEQEEIHFFKYIKPKVLGKYIYYVHLFEIESHRYNASIKFQIKYLNQTQKELNKYLNNNIQFCQYYWGNKTALDNLYFLRVNSNYRLSISNLCVLMDYKYSTARDATAAAIIAYDRLIKYIDNEILLLRNVSSINSSNFHSNATFTDHTVYLVERIRPTNPILPC